MFVRLHLGTGVDTSDNIIFLSVDVHIQIGFVTQFFHNVDMSFDYSVGRICDKHFLVVNIFRADTQNDGLMEVFFVDYSVCLFGRNNYFILAESCVRNAVLTGKRCVEQVHLRRSQEGCDEQVLRAVIQELRSIYLLHDTVFHDDDTGTHGHCLYLVVGDVNKGGCKLVVKLGDFGSHLHTQFCVEVGQRLVEKEYLRFTDYCTTERDTLTLTAGKSFRLTGEKRFDAENGCGFTHAGIYFLGIYFAQFKTERHIVVNGHVRIQSVVLEHHRYIAVLRIGVVYQLIVDVKLARGDFFQTGNHTQGGGLTATGRSDEYDKFFIVDFEVEVAYSLDVAVVDLVNVS